MSTLSVFMNEGLYGFLGEPYDVKQQFFTDVGNCFGRKNLKELLMKYENSSYNDIVIPKDMVENAIDEYCKMHHTTRTEIDFNPELIYYVFQVMATGMIALQTSGTIYKNLTTNVLACLKNKQAVECSKP